MDIKKHYSLIHKVLGIEMTHASHAERIVSALGGFIAIFSIFSVSHWVLGSDDIGIIVASMGASAVLLFAIPHGQLSQPWAIFGGHIISALIGITCAKLIPHEIIAASAAVGIAIGAMYYFKCIHPPGGATALSAVIGGESIQSLGYQFVITPVLMNVVIILLTAFVYNYIFSWRRYPIYINQVNKIKTNDTQTEHEGVVSHGDFVYALSQIDSFVDVSEYDLLRIYELATNRSRNRHLNTNEIIIGSFYSNGEYGDNWSVRQVVDESPNSGSEQDMIIYKVVAGQGRRSSDCITKAQFSIWAKHEVVRDEENWKRVP